jgi:hypothetical protein
MGSMRNKVISFLLAMSLLLGPLLSSASQLKLAGVQAGTVAMDAIHFTSGSTPNNDNQVDSGPCANNCISDCAGVSDCGCCMQSCDPGFISHLGQNNPLQTITTVSSQEYILSFITFPDRPPW